MALRLRITPTAQRQIDDFVDYLRAYSEDFAVEQVERLDRVLVTHILHLARSWGYFSQFGAPYRAYLFRVGRRTQYWIIYMIDEAEETVDIVQFWNTSRDPSTLEF